MCRKETVRRGTRLVCETQEGYMEHALEGCNGWVKGSREGISEGRE